MCAPLPADRNAPASRRERGLTLVELIVAMVIVAVGVGGVLLTYNVAVRGSVDPMITKQAMEIAEALLEEVQLAPFTRCDPDDPKYADPNPDPTIGFGPLSQDVTTTGAAGCTAGSIEVLGAEAGDVRPFDNVSDYDGLALPTITDVSGTTIAGLGAYSANITIVPANLNTIAAASGDAFLITVAVTAPGGNVYSLEGYRARYAPNAVP